MAKHRDGQAPRGDQPMTGSGGRGSGITPKGVVFRKADGSPAVSKKAGKASRLRIPKWLGGKGDHIS